MLDSLMHLVADRRAFEIDGANIPNITAHTDEKTIVRFKFLFTDAFIAALSPISPSLASSGTSKADSEEITALG